MSLQQTEPFMAKKASVLDEIVARRRTEMALDFRSGKWSSAALLRRALSVPGPSSVQARDRLSKKGSVCAEFKRRSPTKGVLEGAQDGESLDVEERVLAYARGGAAVVSVLTEPHYFDGSISDLERARAALDTLGEKRRPALLLKDFVVCEEQLAEARICGADIALLIVRILPPDTLQRFIQYAECIGLDALVEVNNEEELDVALQAGATLIGVNNRNLDTFEVDLGTTERVARRLPASRHCTLIALSGVVTLSDAEWLCSVGADGILVGETLMRSDDPARSVSALLSGEARSALVNLADAADAH